MANQAPVARHTGPYTTTSGVPVLLDATRSTDPDGNPVVKAHWVLRTTSGVLVLDLTTYDLVAAVVWHRVEALTVRLTVTDNFGATSHSTTTTLTVTAASPTFVRLDLTGPTEVRVPKTAQFTATEVYTDGSSVDVTASALWRSSDLDVATVTAGLVTAIAEGSVTLTASVPMGSRSVSLIVNPPVPVPDPPPVVTLSVSAPSIMLGQSVTLTWTTTFTTTLVASGDWSGSKALAGSEVITPGSVGVKTYTLTAQGAGGTRSAQVSLNVTTVPVPPPTVSLSANPPSIVLGQSVLLTWTSTNAASATASGAWTGSKPVNGSETQTPSGTGTSTYTLQVTGSGGMASTSVSVPVAPLPPPGVKTPLSIADFTYQGCFRLGPYPGYPSTTIFNGDPYSRLSFSATSAFGSPLALRVVNGERRFFTIGHINGGGKISEFIPPAVLGQTVATAPYATTANYWNLTPYTSRPSASYPSGNIFSIVTEGLFWDEARQLLWWTFADVFDTIGVGPTLGYAKLASPPAAQAFGPFDLNTTVNFTQNVRGWILEVPPSVRAVNGGRRFVVGNRFDSILARTYFGPSMIGFDEPSDSSIPTANGYPPWGPANRFIAGTNDVLRYGPGVPSNHDSHGVFNYLTYLRRSTDYSVMGVAPGAPPQTGGAGGTNVNPSGGFGYCQSVDLTVGGVWVETATKAGVVVTGGQASGRNWYTEDGYVNGVQIPNDPRGISGWSGNPSTFNGGRVGSEFFNPAFYLFSEQDLIDGASQGYGHWELNPTIWRHPVSGAIGPWTFGAPVFDAATRRLYVSQDRSYSAIGESFPVVHCWEVAN